MPGGRGSKSFWDYIGEGIKGLFTGSNLGDNSSYGSFLLNNSSPGYTNNNSALYGTPDNATIIAGAENAITGNLDYQRVLDQLYKEQEFNRNEAQKNRDFQLMMSNTAYQRQMEDLQAAGINPALVLGQGGASAASGSSASSSGKNVHSTSSQLLSTLVGGLMNITNSALKAETLEEKKELIEAKANAYKKPADLPDNFKNQKNKSDFSDKEFKNYVKKLSDSEYKDLFK